MNISDASMASFLGEGGWDAAGFSVSRAGDVNGDGMDDMIIGAQNNGAGGAGAGQTYLIFGKASGWSMDTNLSLADASFIGEDDGDNSGHCVADAGDVNGDGYDDFLIGANKDEDGGNGAGQTYLILGKASGWTMDTDLSLADASFIGEDDGDNSGHTVDGAEDVNGDGFDDILIGAYGDEDGGGGNAGQTYLILGKASGWAMDTDLSQSDASFWGEEGGDWSAYSVAGAGDVNGDVFDDLLVGASDNDAGGNAAGQAYLILGKASGWAMDTDLSASSASFWGEESVDYSGITVSGPGDVNGDGYDDIFIGGSNNDEGGDNFGQYYLILGRATGWAMDTDLSLSDASFIGESGGSWTGRQVSGAGDVNGDGYADLLVGDSYDDEGGSGAGQTYLVYGKASGWSMDQYLNQTEVSFTGEDANDQAGYSAYGAGDINGDGNEDILVGAPGDEEGGPQAGQAFLISIEGFSEPLVVYDIKVRNGMGDEVSAADIGETVLIEMTGLDRNASHMDKARVNVTFSTGKPGQITLGLMETGLNTGLYRGSYKVNANADYFVKMRFSSYIDPGKNRNVVVDYPYRPESVSTLGVYSSPAGTSTMDKLDLGQTGFFKCSGLDSNKLAVDKAFVNLTSDRNSSFREMMVMTETGQATGTYIVAFTVPYTMQYFENITLTSVETPAVGTRFMVHTPVQLRATGPYLEAVEDIEYRVGFYNFGYSSVTWTLTTDAYWLTWDGTKNELFGTPRNIDVGKDIWKVMVTISDDQENRFELIYDLTVRNMDPSVITEPLTECIEYDPYYLDLDSNDDEGGETTWYLNTDADFLSIEKDTGILKGNPIGVDIGGYIVNVQVRDGKGGIGALIYNLTVIGRNDGPQITTTDIKQVEQDTPFRRDYDVFDPDEGDTHHWTLRTDADWLGMENDTGVLFGKPDGYDVGDWLVNITVTDKGGLRDSREFTFRVIDMKDRPVFDSVPEDTELLHGRPYYFDLNASDPDKETILVFSMDTEPESDMAIDPRTGEVHWIASFRSMPGTGDGMVVRVRVSDGELFSVHEFTIRVIPTMSPTVELLSPVLGSRTLSSYALLEWSGSDPENEPLTYTIYLADSMSSISAKRADDIVAEGITEENLNRTGLVQGKTYYWTVVPDDGCTQGTCSNGIFSFRVNSRPVLKKVEDRTLEVDVRFRLKLSGSDGDQDDTLRYELVKGPSGSTVKAETGMIEWTPGADQVGTHTITIRAKDGFEGAVISFDIEVVESSGTNLGLILGAFIFILMIIIIALVLFIVVFRKRPSQEETVIEEDDEESKRIREELDQLRSEKDWEATHSKPSDQVVASVPSSVTEAHAQDRTLKKMSYEDLYGQPAPDRTEELTTVELKGELEKLTEELKDSMERT